MNKKRCITVSRKNLSTLSCLLSRRRKKPPNLPKFGARPLQSSKQHGACPTHQTSHFCVRPLLSAKQHALHPPPSTYLYITWISPPPPPPNSLGAHSNLSSNLGRAHSNIFRNLGAPTPNYQAIRHERTSINHSTVRTSHNHLTKRALSYLSSNVPRT